MNQATAITQYGLNATNQVNPWGSVNYTQIGNWEDGTPQFQQTTTLSPEQQAIFNETQAAQQNMAGIANQQSAFLQDYFSRPFSSDAQVQSNIGGSFSNTLGPGYQTGVNLATSYAGADDFSMDRQRVEDALWERTAGDRSGQEQAMLTRLANSGIRPGSAAYDAEMERMQRQNTDARLATILAGGQEQSRLVNLSRDAAAFGNDAALAGAAFGNQSLLNQSGFQNQASAQQAGFANQAAAQQFGQDLSVRNQPINELSALMSGSQVSNPATQSGPTPQVGVAGVDYAGLVNQNYQQQLQASQGLWGGLGGLFGTGLSMFSDRRLKQNIRRIGQTDGGTPIYAYNYVWGGPTQIGAMADEVPHAASMHESGFAVVDYGKVV